MRLSTFQRRDLGAVSCSRTSAFPGEQTQGRPWHGPAGRVTGGGGECAARGGDGETAAPSNTLVADRVPPGEPGRPDEEAQT